MADKRMLSKKVTDDDHFTALSSSAQALYLHLSVSADDDGFCNQVSLAMFKAHASVQDLEALLEKRYIFQFDNGVIVIKHWRMANALRKDRYTPTVFQEELAKLKLKPNGAYTWLPDGCQMVAERLPQNSIDKNSIDKSRLDKISNTSSNEDVSSTDVQRITDSWNSLNISRITKIVSGTARYKLLRSRIAEYGIDEVLRAIENVRTSSFLRGGNSRGWICTFDWLIKPNNFPKVLDGNYADHAERKSKKASELDDAYRMMQEWSEGHDSE